MRMPRRTASPMSEVVASMREVSRTLAARSRDGGVGSSGLQTRTTAAGALATMIVALASIVALGPPAAVAGPIEALGVLWGGALTNRSFEEPRPGGESSTGRVWGWTVGGYADWRLPWRHYGLTTEISIVEKGASRAPRGIHADGLQRSDTIESRNSYVSLPVMVERRFGSDRLCAFAFAGPSLEILTGNQRLVEARHLSRTSAAIHLGLGMRWAGAVETRLRYIRDLTDSIGDDPATASLETVLNRGLVIQAGVRLPL